MHFLFQDVIIIDLDVSFITQKNNFGKAVSDLESNVAKAKASSKMQAIQVSSSERMILNTVNETATYGVCVNGSVFGLNPSAGHNQQCRKSFQISL